jgi:hypothetical protein
MFSKIIHFLAKKLVSESRFIKLSDRLFHYPSIEDNKEHVKRFKQTLHQALLNKAVMPFNLNRIWPSWVYKQMMPKSPFFSLNENPLSLNNTSKLNWTVLSSPKSDTKAIVDPNGLISPSLDSWSLDFWVSNSTKIISPSYVQDIKQIFSTDPPSISTHFEIEKLALHSEVISSPLAHKSTLLNAVTITNNGDKAIKFSFYFSIRPYNPLGISRIDTIHYLSQEVLMVNNKIGLVLDEKPDNVVCLNFKDGDVSEHTHDWDMILKSNCPEGLASAFVEYKLTLQPEQSKIITCKIPENAPLYKKKETLNTEIDELKTLRFQSEKNHLSFHWAPYMPQESSCKLPSKTLQSLFNKNVIHLLSHAKKNFISNDTRSTKASYADSLTLIHTLQTIGSYTLANEYIAHLLIKKHWYLLNQDAMIPPADIGRLLFLIKKSYHCTPDKSWIEKYFPQIENMINHMSQSRIRSHHSKPYLRGLIKKQNPFPMSGQKDHYLVDNFWALTAVESAIFFANILKKDVQIIKYKGLQNQIKASIDLFCHHIEEKEAFIPLFPITEKQYTDSRLIDTLANVYPLHIINPHDPRVTHTLQQIDRHCMYNQEVFTSTFPIGLDSNRSFQLAQIYAHRQDAKALHILDHLIESSSETGQWPSANHPQHHEGCSGEGQSALSSANFLLLIRSLLLQEEEKDTLHITPCIPASWLDKARPITLQNYATKFGPISFSLTPSESCVELTLAKNFHTAPKTIKVSLPVPIKEYYYGGKTHEHGSCTLTLPKKLGNITLYI